LRLAGYVLGVAEQPALPGAERFGRCAGLGR